MHFLRKDIGGIEDIVVKVVDKTNVKVAPYSFCIYALFHTVII